MTIGTKPLLRIDGLGVRIGSQDIVRDIPLGLAPGEVLGLVGESGSGKTTIALALLGYRPDGATFSGRVEFASRDVLTLPPVDLQALRGRRIAYVPQNPTTALNPARRIGTLMAEQLAVHGLPSDLESLGNALRDVGLVDASRVLASFPHQLSGGQQQRVVLALATLCSPDILVLDEPTTGLDVTTQAVVISHLRRLRDERRIAMVYVTHDLDLLSGIATHLQSSMRAASWRAVLRKRCSAPPVIPTHAPFWRRHQPCAARITAHKDYPALCAAISWGPAALLQQDVQTPVRFVRSIFPRQPNLPLDIWRRATSCR